MDKSKRTPEQTERRILQARIIVVALFLIFLVALIYAAYRGVVRLFGNRGRPRTATNQSIPITGNIEPTPTAGAPVVSVFNALAAPQAEPVPAVPLPVFPGQQPQQVANQTRQGQQAAPGQQTTPGQVQQNNPSNLICPGYPNAVCPPGVTPSG